jgi:hypothetical protein
MGTENALNQRPKTYRMLKQHDATTVAVGEGHHIESGAKKK